jgi:hypothetical protein
VLADAAGHRARTRREGRRRAVLVFAIAALAGLPLFFVWGGFGHVAARPAQMTAGIAVGALLLAVACASIAWRRGKSAVGRSQGVLLGVAALVPVATYVWLVSWHDRYVEPFSRLGYRCLALTIASGLPLLFAALYLRKRTVVAHPVASGAALGAAAGAFGSVTVELWCPLTSSPHVLLGHVTPIVLLAVSGALIGRFTLPIAALAKK